MRKSQASRNPSTRPVPEAGTLCLETRGREIMAILVNDVVAQALRLDLFPPDGPVKEANGAAFPPRSRRSAK